MKKKGMSRALLSIMFLLLVLLAVALFFLIRNKLLEKIFFGGIG